MLRIDVGGGMEDKYLLKNDTCCTPMNSKPSDRAVLHPLCPPHSTPLALTAIELVEDFVLTSVTPNNS